MKCYYHPKDDAVAVCKSCGRGTCQECTVIVSNVSYCKNCVEASRIPSQTAPFPTGPTGTPSRTPFITGAIGVIISGVASILLLFGSGLFGFYGLYSGPGSIWLVIPSVVLGAGLIVAGIGYLGVRRNYGLGIGTAGFALSLVSAIFLFSNAAVNILFPFTYYRYYYSSPLYLLYVIVLALALIMFGVTQILWGVTHINSRRYTGNSGLGIATGIILIISGSLTATVLISPAGLVLFFVGGILALLVFLMSRVPTQQIQSV